MPQALKKSLMKTHSRLLFLDDVPEFAAKLAKSIVAGDVVCLTGEIGAGKTTFIFHLLRALGVARGTAFSSPTFTILNQYVGANNHSPLQINHVDLYRLSRFCEFEALDILSLFESPGAVSFVEWGDKFTELKSLYTKTLHFEYVDSKNLERWVQFEGF